MLDVALGSRVYACQSTTNDNNIMLKCKIEQSFTDSIVSDLIPVKL